MSGGRTPIVFDFGAIRRRLEEFEGVERVTVYGWVRPADGGPAKPNMPEGAKECLDGTWIMPDGRRVRPVPGYMSEG
jgi:hypothetical protein